MNKIVKTVVILLAGLALTTGTAYAAPHHRYRPVRIHRCAPPPAHHHHHHHDCGAGLIGGLVGGLVGGIVGAIAN